MPWVDEDVDQCNLSVWAIWDCKLPQRFWFEIWQCPLKCTVCLSYDLDSDSLKK